MDDDSPPRWYHVTPMFLLPRILESGGIRCGADVEADKFPRRASSQANDNQLIKDLDGRRPSDCVLLFKKRSSHLLNDKLAKTRKAGSVWKSYPHIRLSLCAAACMNAAKQGIFGCPDNVGRAIRQGRIIAIKKFRLYTEIRDSDSQELMIPADHLEGRRMPISAIRSVECFSQADQILVQQHCEWSGFDIPATLDAKPKYSQGQSIPPGSEFLDLTRQFYKATWDGEREVANRLLKTLGGRCFD